MSWKRGHKTASPTSSLLFGPHRGTRQSTARLVSWGPEITEAGVRSCFGSCCACDEQTRLKGGTNVASELEADPVIRCLWGKQNELLRADQSEPWSDILEARAEYVQVNLDVLARVRISCLQEQVRSAVGKSMHGLETYVRQ